VISLVALFVALAGTAYALERGEVRAKHIAADAVRAKHVKDAAIGGPAVDETTLDPVPAAETLDGLDLAEVTGDAQQDATGTGTVFLTDCNLVGAVTQSLTLTRPARVLVLASGTFSDGDGTAVEAIVELRQGATTVANSPSMRTPTTAAGNGRYDVTAVLRDGSSEEIPAGDYTLRVVVDASPCTGNSASVGSEALGHVVLGAR
jgi:hypothetical protein